MIRPYIFVTPVSCACVAAFAARLSLRETLTSCSKLLPEEYFALARKNIHTYIRAPTWGSVLVRVRFTTSPLPSIVPSAALKLSGMFRDFELAQPVSAMALSIHSLNGITVLEQNVFAMDKPERTLGEVPIHTRPVRESMLL